MIRVLYCRSGNHNIYFLLETMIISALCKNVQVKKTCMEANHRCGGPDSHTPVMVGHQSKYSLQSMCQHVQIYM